MAPTKGPNHHVGTRGHLGTRCLSTQAESRISPRSQHQGPLGPRPRPRPAPKPPGTGAPPWLCSRLRKSGAGQGARTRRAGSVGGQPGRQLRPRLPGGDGPAGARELPARTQWRLCAGLSNHARRRLPGESLLGKKERIPNHKSFAAKSQSHRGAAKLPIWARRDVGLGRTQPVRGPRQVSAAPGGAGAGRVPSAARPALTLAAAWAKRGGRGAARPPRGEEGGARQAQVPAGPAGSAADRGAPPAPGLHAGERLEEPARERTASGSPAQRLGRRSPRSGDN